MKTCLQSGIIDCTKITLHKTRRWGVYRSEKHFILKDYTLFYTGPKHNVMRLVVMSDDQKRAVLNECHTQKGTGNHGSVRSTMDRVVAAYYWRNLQHDVEEWVKENWHMLGMDLIGPLKETSRANKYILTMTDLFSKFVVAEPLQSKSAAEVSAAITTKFYLFGMAKRVLTDQGKAFMNELNSHIFALLNIKHAVSSSYHPQTNGQDERTNQNIKRALRRYVTEQHNDWDVHLQAVVYGINTAKQRSTKNTPFFLLFHRRPLLPEVLNTNNHSDQVVVGDPEEDLENRVKAVTELNEKVLRNIERAQEQQKKSFASRKRRHKVTHHVQPGEEVLLMPKKQKLGRSLK